MFRKTVITLTAIAALGLGSTAMAAGGGGGHIGSLGGAGIPAMHGGGPGSMMHGASVRPTTRGGPMATAPIAGGRAQGWNGRAAWSSHDNFHDHFNYHHRDVFAFGFSGPSYDYAYDSCWTQVPTYYGWQWVYVCGDSGYY